MTYLLHELAITRLMFGETEMYVVHTDHTAQHIIAWHFDGHNEFVSDDTTNLPNLRGQAYWYPWVPSSEAGRGCRRVPQRQEPAQPLPLPIRLGGTKNILIHVLWTPLTVLLFSYRPTDTHTHTHLHSLSLYLNG